MVTLIYDKRNMLFAAPKDRGIVGNMIVRLRAFAKIVPKNIGNCTLQSRDAAL